MRGVLTGASLFIFGVGVGYCFHGSLMDSSTVKDIFYIIFLVIFSIGIARHIFMQNSDKKSNSAKINDFTGDG